MASIQALLFDLDGVLIDSEPLHRRTWIEALDQFGLRLTKDEESILQGRRAVQIVEWLRDHRGKEAVTIDADALLIEKRKRFDARMHEELTALPGIDEFLRAQKGTLRLGLVTSARLKYVGKIMKLFGWRNLFDMLVGAEHVAQFKPHPEPFILGVGRFKLEPAQCLVFEDSRVGIESARAARCPVVGVATTLSPPTLRKTGAQWTIRDFRDHATLTRAIQGQSADGFMGSVRRLFGA